MNTDWSDCVQGIRTLYESRRLRFDDRFRNLYAPLLGLDEFDAPRILEVGCGPGALAEALLRWKPGAVITGVDRDSAFVEFARGRVPGANFIEGDAAALPFPDASFDVAISNTVVEHVEPNAFFGEQLRVLKPGGICLVLSSRRGIRAQVKRPEPDETERAFWERVAEFDDSFERLGVGKYAMSEAELPAAMERFGFADVRTGYVAVPLTPDDPSCPPEMARAILDERRHSELDALESVRHTAPGKFTEAELTDIADRIHRHHDARLAQFERGEKQWDAEVSLIMVARGRKPG